MAAFLKHVNLSNKKPRSDGNWIVEMDDTPTIACLEWLKCIARGAYFLETGFCLRPKEKLRFGNYFIRPAFLTIPRDRKDACARGTGVITESAGPGVSTSSPTNVWRGKRPVSGVNLYGLG